MAAIFSMLAIFQRQAKFPRSSNSRNLIVAGFWANFNSKAMENQNLKKTNLFQ